MWQDKEIMELAELYHMYEFSDEFKLFENARRCGDIFNYVKTGLLTVDEALSALVDY